MRERLGLFIDGPFRADESGRVFCGQELCGFMSFSSAVGSHFASMLIIARQAVEPDAAAFELAPFVRLAPLPGYENLRQVGSVMRAIPKTVPAIWRALGEVDVAWVTGDHPFGPVVALMARMRGKRTVLLVRQDTMRYYRARLPSQSWRPVLIPVWLLQRLSRLLARFLPVTAVGEPIAKRYGGPGPRLLEMRVTNYSSSAAAALGSGPDHGALHEPVRLLSVGRVAPEKNPLLAVEVLERLNRDLPGGFELTWVGKGPMREAVLAEAERRGVADRLHLAGFVPVGPELFKHYADADVLVHTSLTEGLPGVVLEALAQGVPVVATDVGGVRSALDGGGAGILVPAEDADAIVDAVKRLVTDQGLRLRSIERGRELTRDLSIETESARVARFLDGENGE